MVATKMINNDFLTWVYFYGNLAGTTVGGLFCILLFYDLRSTIYQKYYRALDTCDRHAVSRNVGKKNNRNKKSKMRSNKRKCASSKKSKTTPAPPKTTPKVMPTTRDTLTKPQAPSKMDSLDSLQPVQRIVERAHMIGDEHVPNKGDYTTMAIFKTDA